MYECNEIQKINDKGAQKLAIGIVKCAAEDYMKALSNRKVERVPPEVVMNDIEHFFFSPWYAQLTNLNPEYLIRKLREEVKND